MILTPNYSPDGKVFEIWVEPQRVIGESINEDKLISAEVAEEILNEIVPLEFRKDKPKVMSFETGCHETKIEEFEKVWIERIYICNNEMRGVRLLFVRWKSQETKKKQKIKKKKNIYFP